MTLLRAFAGAITGIFLIIIAAALK